MSNIKAMAYLTNLLLMQTALVMMERCFVPVVIQNGTGEDLSKRKINHFPHDLPPNITWLNLSHNKITAFTNREVLPNLVHLDMSYNKIHNLRSNISKFMPKLENLYLNNNNLILSSSYPDGAFSGLPLRTLHLHHNDDHAAGSYPATAFGELTYLQELSVDTFEETNFTEGFKKMKNLKRLLLGHNGCKLNCLENDSLEVFADVNIEILNLDYCPLKFIAANAFWHLKSIQCLTISHNSYLSPKVAMKSMYGLRGINMTTIHFDEVVKFSLFRQNKFENNILLTEDLLPISDVCVKNMSLKRNKILWFADIDWLFNKTFANCIEYLDISDNDLYGDATVMFKLSFMVNLKGLDMSRHLFQGIKYPLQKGHSEKLKENATLGFTLPATLEYLNLNGFSINEWVIPDTIFFWNAFSLRELRFAYNGMWGFSKRMQGLKELSSLDFSGNICGNMSDSFFEDFTGLTKLNMANSHLDKPENYLSVNGSKLLKSLDKLERIILSKNGLSTIDPSMFKAKPLQVIDLSVNRFETMPFDLQTTDSLQHLFLEYNLLTVLEQSDMDIMDRLGSKNNLTVNLKGNTLSCSCENLHMVFWLYNSKVHFEDIETYSCLHEDGQTYNISDTYKNIDLLWRRCYGKVWLSVSITCFAVILMIMVFIYILCRRKTMLLNILLRLFGFSTLIKEPSCKDFKHDIMLGYSEHDYQYIYNTVSEFLERKHKMRVYISDRDMLPGKSISQEIISAVDSSWKVVLVVTKSFLEDNWCRFITDYAVYVSTFRCSGCVMLVLFNDVRKGDIPPALLNVVEERHIFCDREYWGDEDSLWKDVCCAINP